MLVPVWSWYTALVVPRDNVSFATAFPVSSRSRRRPENVRLLIVVPGLNVTDSALSTCLHGVPFAPDLLVTPIESEPRPGEDAVPVDVTAISVGVVLSANELFEVASDWVVVPSVKARPLLPRWRCSAVGAAAPPLDNATAPIAPT